MSAVSDAERAAYEVYLALPDAALDVLTPDEERAARATIAAATAEARAPYDRLTADLQKLAEEWDMHAATETVWGEDNPERTGGEWEKGYWAALRYAAGRARLLAATEATT